MAVLVPTLFAAVANWGLWAVGALSDVPGCAAGVVAGPVTVPGTAAGAVDAALAPAAGSSATTAATAAVMSRVLVLGLSRRFPKVEWVLW